MQKLSFLLLFILIVSCKNEIKTNRVDEIAVVEKTSQKKDHQVREIKKAVIVPNVDGNMDDPIWNETTWYSIDQRWLGDPYSFEDFFGRYKMAWTPEALYLLVEIKDQTLYDQYNDPLTLWWDDDCVEIFIDADNSGGGHQYSNNAFAYHVALDGNVIDLDKNQKPVLYNNHVKTRRTTKDDVSVWEFEIVVYDDTYEEGKANDAVILQKDQKLGFAVAYNDNDSSKERENFIGSVFIPGEEKNLGWINADVFGTIILRE
ncbi:sugar-binding protein [Aquimarina sp. 2201CG5-10]|uniref:sugar-binding protein n=1 Tax=Aquimarina callyspongiae TaxID=3098150 RepID=UPI002AB3A66B|nr:sugar-binding protein [Aquimarina sp. 2201CG5-10]MDY8137297.1 sugar-binding protein [Aquimarina sp. 2201CG5-10]